MRGNDEQQGAVFANVSAEQRIGSGASTAADSGDDGHGVAGVSAEFDGPVCGGRAGRRLRRRGCCERCFAAGAVLAAERTAVDGKR